MRREVRHFCVTQVVLAQCCRARAVLLDCNCLASQQARSHSHHSAKTRPPHHHRSTSPQHNPSHASPAIAQGSIISYQHPPNVRLPSLPPHRPHRCKTLSAKSALPQPWTTTTTCRRVLVGMPGNATGVKSSGYGTSTEKRCDALCYCCYRSSRLHDAYSPPMSTCKCRHRRATCRGL